VGLVRRGDEAGGGSQKARDQETRRGGGRVEGLGLSKSSESH